MRGQGGVRTACKLLRKYKTRQKIVSQTVWSRGNATLTQKRRQTMAEKMVSDRESVEEFENQEYGRESLQEFNKFQITILSILLWDWKAFTILSIFFHLKTNTSLFVCMYYVQLYKEYMHDEFFMVNNA